MKNRIKGIIIVRENTDGAPKMLKLNSFLLVFLKFIFIFVFLSTAVLLFSWQYVFYRVVNFNEMEQRVDSLTLHSQKLDEIKINIVRINRYLEYFRMVSNIGDVGQVPPTIEEFLRDTALVVVHQFRYPHKEFMRVPSIRPVTGIISRGFDSATHTAIDFVAPRGSPIRATAEGVVSRVFFDEAMGNVVILSHAYGYETLYAHVETVLVREGESVVQGQTIAIIGGTGSTARGIHLHYEVLRNGVQIDPRTTFL